MISLDELLALEPAERLLYLKKAAQEMELPLQLIEKDFWVTFLLQLLFNLEDVGNALTFKGGTSLSKVFGLIRRFSEDIDLTIEKSFFGYEGAGLPENAPSAKKRERLIEELSQKCRTYIQSGMLSNLSEMIESRVPSTTGWKLEIDDTDPDGQSLIFRYPISVTQASLYIPDWIKIEFGARGVHWPVEAHSISSYLHSALPTSLTPWKFNVRVLAPTRTFWEKATILHAFANYAEGKKVPQRQSRHYYDLYCLLNSDIHERALKEKHLLADVCDHKSVYFRQGWANYNEAKSGRLKLVPPGHVLQQVVADYEKMAEMLFDDAPAWSNVVSELSKFEKELMNQ